MMSFKSTIKAGSLALFMLVPASASGQVPPDMSAFMPSKAEMRESLAGSGMTPDQIEQVLNSIDFPQESPSNTDVPSHEMTLCVDENENDICDTDESDTIITQCREAYQTQLYTTSRELYGDALGRNSVEVSQTCSMAAAGGTMTFTSEGGWVSDMDKLLEAASYWQAVLSHARYLSESNIPEIGELSEGRIQEIISTFPRDMQAMFAGAGTEEVNRISRPINDKCERIRSRVRGNYRNNALVDKVCIKYVPDTVSGK